MSSQSQEFLDLLLDYSREDMEKKRAGIEKRLWDKYGAEITVAVVDMSGFTRLAEAHGIVHYLSMVRRMQLTSKPIIESYGGRVVKFEADNAFASFSGPAEAVSACIALNHAMNAANLVTPDELDIFISCGIDHGKCLIPGPGDYFGNPVNRASKLGEDLAEPGDILVTEEAMKMAPKEMNIKTKPVKVMLGGREVAVCSVVYT